MNRRWLSLALAMILSCSAAFTTITLNKGASDNSNLDFEVPEVPPADDGGSGGEEELPPAPLPPDAGGDEGGEEPEIPVPPEEEDPAPDVDGVTVLPFYRDTMPNIAILGEIPELGAVLKAVPAPTIDGASADTLYLADGIDAEALCAALLTGVAARDGNGETLNVTLYKLDREPWSTEAALQGDGRTHTATLQAADRFGRTVSIKRDFHIVVTPEIVVDNGAFATEDGAVLLYVNETTAFDPVAGVSVLDPNGRLGTESLSVRGSVDPAAAGTYTLEYALDDGYNNTVTAARTVVVRERNRAEIVALYERLEDHLAAADFTAVKKGVQFTESYPFKRYGNYSPFYQITERRGSVVTAETYFGNGNASYNANIKSVARRAVYDYADPAAALYQTGADVVVSPPIASNVESNKFGAAGSQYDAAKMNWDGAITAAWDAGAGSKSVAELNLLLAKNMGAERYRHLVYRLQDDLVTDLAYEIGADGGSITAKVQNADTSIENAFVKDYLAGLNSLFYESTQVGNAITYRDHYAIDQFNYSEVKIVFDAGLRIVAIEGADFFRTNLYGGALNASNRDRLLWKETFTYTTAPALRAAAARTLPRNAQSAADASPAVTAEPLTVVNPGADTLYPWFYAGITAGDAELYAVGVKSAGDADFTALEESVDLTPFCAPGVLTVRYYATDGAAYTVFDRPVTVAERVDATAGAHYRHPTERGAPAFAELPDLALTPSEDGETFLKLLSKDVRADAQAHLYSITASDGATAYFADESFRAPDFSARADTYTVRYVAAADNGNYTVGVRTVIISAKPTFQLDFSVYAADETDVYQGVTRVILTPDDKTGDPAALRELALRGVSVSDPSDPELTLARAKIESTIDFGKQGTYYVRIRIANAAGVEATLTRYFFYRNPAPVITLDNTVYAGIGTVKTAANGAEYIELKPDADLAAVDLTAGLAVRDELDEMLTTAAVTLTGTLDPAKPGVYQTIAYTVTNRFGATGTAYRNFLIRDYTAEELADSVAVYERIAARMATETYFQKSQGSTTAKTAFTNSSLKIYGTMDVTPGEIYFENISSGNDVVGVNVSFAKRVWLKKGDAGWNGSFGAVEGQSTTAALINADWKYAYNDWTGGGAAAYTDTDFTADFGRPVNQLFCYPITAETLKTTEKNLTKENGVYTMTLEIDVSKAAAVDGYQRQVNTISGQTVKSFNYAKLTLKFDDGYRLLQYSVSEEYVVKTMSAKTTNNMTYVNYFDPEGFAVRTF